MNIYTYYEDIHITEIIPQSKLIDLWKYSWEKNGFNPIVLSISDVITHPLYDKFIEDIQNIHANISGHTISKYGLSCYRRWLAYANLNNNDIFYVSDYDVINNGFKPTNLQKTKDKISFLDTLCPSIAVGNSDQFLNFCLDILKTSKNQDIIDAYKVNKLQNYHDQEFLWLKFETGMLSHNHGDYDIIESRKYVSLYESGNPEMEKYKIIHVAHSCATINEKKFPELDDKQMREAMVREILKL